MRLLLKVIYYDHECYQISHDMNADTVSGLLTTNSDSLRVSRSGRSLHGIQENAYESLVQRSKKKNDQRQSSGSMSILLPSQASKPDLSMRLDRLDAVSFTDDNLHALSSELTRIVEYYDIQGTYKCQLIALASPLNVLGLEG